MVDESDYRKLQHEADRYRQAAQDALEQLDWYIGYLHGSRKGNIVAALGRNRAHIRKSLLNEPEEPTTRTAREPSYQSHCIREESVVAEPPLRDQFVHLLITGVAKDHYPS